jgi:hypothetical protein
MSNLYNFDDLEDETEKDLSIYHGGQYVENEESVGVDDGDVIHHKLIRKNVLDMSAVGSVYYKDERVASFLTTGKAYSVTKYLSEGMPQLLKLELNNKTGVFTLTWDKKVRGKNSKIVVSYEYINS